MSNQFAKARCSKPLAVVGLETTGLNPAQDLITKITILRIEPSNAVTSYVQRIHVGHDAAEDCLPWRAMLTRRRNLTFATVYRHVRSLLIGSNLVGYNLLITEDRAQRLQEIHEQRVGTQRFTPRSRDPNKNPLGGRIFDWNCGWLMYRSPHRDTFNYTCGWYQQSHATRCSHNHVRGLVATELALGMIWQQILCARVAESVAQPRVEQELERLRAELREVQAQRQKVIRKFAAEDTSRFAEDAKTIVTELWDREDVLNQELSKFQGIKSAMSTTDITDSALALLRQLPELADDDHNLADIGQAFRTLNLQMLVRFQPIKKKVRVENKVSGGVITLGDALPPTKKYTGPTATTAVKATKPLKTERSKGSKSSKHESESGSDREAKSSRDVYLRER